MRRTKPPPAPLISDRRNITQPPDWWHAFEAASRSAGLTLSEWIGEQCRAALPAAVQAQLSRRRLPGERVQPAPSPEK